jgi:hypothetical protein
MVPRLRLLKLRVLATKWRPHVAAGVSPQSAKRKEVVSREAAAALGRTEIPVAASRLSIIFSSLPWAYAHGYVLPSLRDSGNVQLHQSTPLPKFNRPAWLYE